MGIAGGGLRRVFAVKYSAIMSAVGGRSREMRARASSREQKVCIRSVMGVIRAVPARPLSLSSLYPLGVRTVERHSL